MVGTRDRTYRRNSLRYPGYDYSQPGAVFVTINTHENQCLFGLISRGSVQLSAQGELVQAKWTCLPERFPDILLDEFIVMPNHVHAIVFTGTDPSLESTKSSIGLLINSFQNSVTAGWRKGVASENWPKYEGKLWQRDYHDRIIRTDIELEAFREYILGNPARWEETRRG